MGEKCLSYVREWKDWRKAEMTNIISFIYTHSVELSVASVFILALLYVVF